MVDELLRQMEKAVDERDFFRRVVRFARRVVRNVTPPSVSVSQLLRNPDYASRKFKEGWDWAVRTGWTGQFSGDHRNSYDQLTYICKEVNEF